MPVAAARPRSGLRFSSMGRYALERAVNVASECPQIGDFGKCGFQSAHQLLTLPRSTVPAREIALQLLLRPGYQFLKLSPPLFHRGGEHISASVLRLPQLPELLLYVEYQLRQLGGHALVVLGELLAHQLQPVAPPAHRVAQGAIAAGQKRRTLETRLPHRRRRRREAIRMNTAARPSTEALRVAVI